MNVLAAPPLSPHGDAIANSSSHSSFSFSSLSSMSVGKIFSVLDKKDWLQHKLLDEASEDGSFADEFFPPLGESHQSMISVIKPHATMLPILSVDRAASHFAPSGLKNSQNPSASIQQEVSEAKLSTMQSLDSVLSPKKKSRGATDSRSVTPQVVSTTARTPPSRTRSMDSRILRSGTPSRSSSTERNQPSTHSLSRSDPRTPRRSRSVERKLVFPRTPTRSKSREHKTVSPRTPSERSRSSRAPHRSNSMQLQGISPAAPARSRSVHSPRGVNEWPLDADVASPRTSSRCDSMLPRSSSVRAIRRGSEEYSLDEKAPVACFFSDDSTYVQLNFTADQQRAPTRSDKFDLADVINGRSQSKPTQRRSSFNTQGTREKSTAPEPRRIHRRTSKSDLSDVIESRSQSRPPTQRRSSFNTQGTRERSIDARSKSRRRAATPHRSRSRTPVDHSAGGERRTASRRGAPRRSRSEMVSSNDDMPALGDMYGLLEPRSAMWKSRFDTSTPDESVAESPLTFEFEANWVRTTNEAASTTKKTRGSATRRAKTAAPVRRGISRTKTS